MVIGKTDRGRDFRLAAWFLLTTIAAVFALGGLSDVLNLRGLATLRQRQWGTVAWAIASGILVLAPIYAALCRRASIPRWLTIVTCGLFVLLAVQVGGLIAFINFGVFAPIFLPDEWIAVVALATGVFGVYTCASGVEVATRGRRWFSAVTRSSAAAASAALVVMGVWAVLYLE